MKKTRACKKCKTEKPISEFHKDRHAVGEHRYVCRICRNILESEYRDNNRERIREIGRKSRNKHREQRLKATRKWKRTKQGLLSKIKSENKRQRNLKSIEMFENPFPDEIEVDYHHPNNLLVIPIPRKLHELTSSNTNIHRNQCEEIIKFIYQLDLNILTD